MRSFLGVPILIRGQAWGNLYLTEKEGADTFGAADEESLVILAGWAALGIEHARLHEQAHRREDELERTVRALESSTAIARAVGGETDLQRVLDLISKPGRALVDARWLAIMLCDDDSLVVKASRRTWCPACGCRSKARCRAPPCVLAAPVASTTPARASPPSNRETWASRHSVRW